MRWGVAWLRLAALYDCMYFVVTTYAYFSSSHLSWQKSSSASTCQIFNSFSHDVVVKNWNCCREQLQIGSKLLSWTPTRFEIISDYWRNFPFIVPRDFFFLSSSVLLSVSNDAWSCVKVWLNCVLIDYFTILTTSCTSFIFFLSHKLMLKQCIQSLKNTSKASMSKNPFKANNTLR